MTTASIDSKIYSYTKSEQIASAVSHGIGALLSVAGLCVLVVLAAMAKDPWRIVSFSIYGATLTILMLSSTLYHSIPNIKVQRYLRVFDHISIFLLIAGTYTPFTLVSMRGPWGWSIFGVIWGLALIGTILKIFFTGRFEVFSLILYALMGWIVVIAFKPFMTSLAPGGLWLTAAGGLAYTVGIIFYAVEKIKFNHAIWHLFVLVGAACHYFAILFYVL